MKVKLKQTIVKAKAPTTLGVTLTLEETKELLGDDTEVEEGEETEEDIDVPAGRAFAKAILAPSDWTVETLVSQLKQNNIMLNPYFQRREAWRPARQARFIESLFLGLPIPEIVLVESKNSPGKFVVLDGKQRLLTIVHFAASDVFKVTPLRLEGLRFRTDLTGKTMEDMKADPTLTSELTQFNNRTVRTVVIKNWPNTDYIHLVFERLNTESVKLSPQELRQALFPGGFVHYASERSSSKWLLKILGTKTPDFRMRDVELFIRHLAFSHLISTYAGNLKRFLDEACESLNKDWEQKKEQIAKDADSLDSAIEATYAIFGEDAFHKWTLEGYETKFNRAVFDVMTYYFANAIVRRLAVEKKVAVLKSFKSLCENEDFRKSVETTTKSIPATQTRLRLWGEILAKELGTRITIPTIKTKKA